MNRIPMGRSSISRLNQLARKYERGGMDASEAISAAASEYGLQPTKTYDESGTLYRTPRGKWVMGWTNGTYVGDGGCGFDDQIEDGED